MPRTKKDTTKTASAAKTPAKKATKTTKASAAKEVKPVENTVVEETVAAPTADAVIAGEFTNIVPEEPIWGQMFNDPNAQRRDLGGNFSITPLIEQLLFNGLRATFCIGHGVGLAIAFLI